MACIRQYIKLLCSQMPLYGPAQDIKNQHFPVLQFAHKHASMSMGQVSAVALLWSASLAAPGAPRHGRTTLLPGNDKGWPLPPFVKEHV